MKQNQTVNVQLILTGEREDCFNTSNFNIHSRKKCFAPATDKDESILIFFFQKFNYTLFSIRDFDYVLLLSVTR